MVVGNGDGLAGFAVAKMSDRAAVQRRAKGMAMNKLQYIERLDSHTIYQVRNSSVFCHPCQIIFFLGFLC